MTDGPSTEREYTEKEIGAILKRASELQAARSPAGSDSGVFGGTTLAQLQQAAVELGIEPDLIARAASDLAVEQGAGKDSWLLGGTWNVDSDQWIPGRIAEDEWPLIVEEMRAATGRIGVPKPVGKGFEWLSHQPDPLHITFTPLGEKTRVRLTARFGEWRILYCFVPTSLAGLFAVILSAVLSKSGWMSPTLFVSLLLGLPGVTLFGGRIAFKRFCAQRRQQMQHLMDRLKQVISHPASNVVSSEAIGMAAASDAVEAVQARLSTAFPSPATSLPQAEEPLRLSQSNQNSG